MTRKFFVIGFIATAIVLGSCSKDNPIGAQTDDVSVINSKHVDSVQPDKDLTMMSVPIKGNCTTTFKILPQLCIDKSYQPVSCDDPNAIPVLAQTIVQGTGLISHLGKCQVYIDQMLDFTAQPPTLQGTVIFTAANGDKLYATHSGTSGASDVPDILPYFGTFTFDGGTGRFAKAVGSATYTGSANMTYLTGQFAFTGTIAY